MMISVFVISLITYLVVMHVLSKHMIIYGRRKFVAMLLVALIVKVAFDMIYPYVPFEGFEIRGIGAVVPGILANNIQKQGWVYTFGSTVALSALTFLLMSVAVRLV